MRHIVVIATLAFTATVFTVVVLLAVGLIP